MYSTWIAWGGRRDGGNVQYVDIMGVDGKKEEIYRT
jgi:hypothetical protein